MRLPFAALLTAASLSAQVYITEWMYSGTDAEFIEFTNLGTSAVDMTGWSYDDDSRTSGTFDLSAFGTIAAGESVILAELEAEAFRTAWGLDALVKIIGELDVNLGRNDEINLYDAVGGLSDRLTFGDQNISGTIRTQNVSGWAPLAALGSNDVSAWFFSSQGDGLDSFLSTGGDLGNPGSYLSAVPEPSTYALIGGALALVGAMVRRRNATAKPSNAAPTKVA